MTNDNSGRMWNGITAGAILLAVVLGIVLYVVTGDAFDAVFAMILVFGLYLAISSRFRNKDEEGYGPSDADVVAVAGILLAGIGVAGFAHSLTGNVLITVAVIIAIVAVVGILMAVKNRNV